jgi:hypothetical protein
MSQIVALTEANGLAGAIVYWSLSGTVELDAIVHKFEEDFMDESWLPAMPSLETVIYRAAQGLCDQRQMIRQIRRGTSWAFVTEKVNPLTAEQLKRGDGRNREKIEWQICARFWIEREGDTEKAVVLAEDAESAFDLDLVKRIKMDYQSSVRTLTAADISAWLLQRAAAGHAVGLRDRGGIYFVPQDRLGEWRELTRALMAVSDHKIYEIPAMRTPEAVEAILESVRYEASQQFEKLDGYLGGETSTRGLNSWERTLAEMREKVSHYVELLGTALPDLEEKFQNLTGALLETASSTAISRTRARYTLRRTRESFQETIHALETSLKKRDDARRTDDKDQ